VCLFWRVKKCLHVTVTPLLSKIRVFNRGISKGLIPSTAKGGQLIPISKLGASLLWKKVQKNLEKNITSLKINRIIPSWNPRSVINECAPINKDSRLISRNQNSMTKITFIVAKSGKYRDLNLNQKINLIMSLKAAVPMKRGQGLSSTI
jgi:hypothetical protein